MKYFTEKELQCQHTGDMILAEDFDKELDDLREACGFPLIVNSCCRSAEHNDAVHGHPRSLHVYDHPHHPTGGCCAIDFSTSNLDGEQFLTLIAEAKELGMSVGIAKSFIHCDTRTATLGFKQTSWLY